MEIGCDEKVRGGGSSELLANHETDNSSPAREGVTESTFSCLLIKVLPEVASPSPLLAHHIRHSILDATIESLSHRVLGIVLF
jgi:hypothetical protein